MTSTSIDLLIRIKNGYMSGKLNIEGLYSGLNESILKILKTQGYIEDFSVNTDKKNKYFDIKLKYDKNNPALTDVRIVSRPGARIYKDYRSLKKVLGGKGISILTTSEGVMTDGQARQKKAGGEVICQIW